MDLDQLRNQYVHVLCSCPKFYGTCGNGAKFRMLWKVYHDLSILGTECSTKEPNVVLELASAELSLFCICLDQALEQVHNWYHF